ncbi:MAG: ATP-binding protein [Bacilli bacterium]|nr:ATP-binding protein [Bacilli bacterium]MDD4407358.1 ATP-binding protein [Bacilli bacterium]
MTRLLNKYQLIERSILTKYRKSIYSKVIKAIEDYELINKNDIIMVCISGGKDSFLLAKCLEEISKHGEIKFDLKYVVMNPGYKEFNINKILENAKILNLDIEIFNTDIFEVVNKTRKKSHCYLCARMRRGHLYNKAKELGCNKIALGHHFNDVIETTLLSVFYAGEVKTMLPKLHSNNYRGIDLIRPLYLVKEDEIISWSNYNNLDFINCACSFTENLKFDSKREEIKKLIKDLKTINKDIDNNIYKALENVNLNCIVGGHKNGKQISFLDDFNKK